MARGRLNRDSERFKRELGIVLIVVSNVAMGGGEAEGGGVGPNNLRDGGGPTAVGVGGIMGTAVPTTSV